jgi:hypothetical protein
MKRHAKVACVICVSTGLLAPFISHAEVKSLTSSELTETYIKDSTIIVTPKKNNKQKTTKKTYSSLTIAPVENNDLDIEELRRAQAHNTGSEVSFILSDESLREASIASTLSPDQTINVPTYQEVTTVPVAELLNDPRYAVPEGNFDIDYKGNDLSLSRTDNQLTFSIGNPHNDVQPINIPEGFNEGPLQIVPRADGGFDLTINIPQDN